MEAWAAARSFHEKSDPPAAGAGSGSGGALLLRDKGESATDPDARLYKKATADKSVPAYQGHALIENRNGLVVAAEASLAATIAEREAAPHVSEYTQGANMGKNSLTEQERQAPRRKISQRKRKLVERVLGWSKLDRPLRQVKLRGLDRVDWFYRMTIVAQNLVRMRRLIPMIPIAALAS